MDWATSNMSLWMCAARSHVGWRLMVASMAKINRPFTCDSAGTLAACFRKASIWPDDERSVGSLDAMKRIYHAQARRFRPGALGKMRALLAPLARRRLRQDCRRRRVLPCGIIGKGHRHRNVRRTPG